MSGLPTVQAVMRTNLECHSSVSNRNKRKRKRKPVLQITLKQSHGFYSPFQHLCTPDASGELPITVLCCTCSRKASISLLRAHIPSTSYTSTHFTTRHYNILGTLYRFLRIHIISPLMGSELRPPEKTCSGPNLKYR